MNDPEHQAAGLAKHLEENGIGKYKFTNVSSFLMAYSFLF